MAKIKSVFRLTRQRIVKNLTWNIFTYKCRILKQLKHINTTFYIQGIDVLVHSAGIVVNGSTIDLPLSEYDRCMNINARSAFILTKECLPHLLKTKGNIVHVSSVTGTNKILLLVIKCYNDKYIFKKQLIIR